MCRDSGARPQAPASGCRASTRRLRAICEESARLASESGTLTTLLPLGKLVASNDFGLHGIWLGSSYPYGRDHSAAQRDPTAAAPQEKDGKLEAPSGQSHPVGK